MATAIITSGVMAGDAAACGAADCSTVTVRSFTRPP
jgi:hypothetical protein